ncbi:MAG: hypothetical protein VR73_03635 [Gammaproteobacteria bacterium BRH_c0]|nr:MAG: hypothetical protein VR73_03635 [Gammaproteobacteria bacterium BRH_c0]
MLSAPQTISRKTLAALIIYTVFTGLLLTVVLKVQLWQLADEEQNALGQALVAQLVESVRQPLMDEDVISIQVILDNLVSDTPQVGRASVSTAGNRLLAQSQGQIASGEKLSQHTAPITLDNTITGQIRVELQSAGFFLRYDTLLWWTLASWGLTTLILALWLVVATLRFSRRLARINASLLSAPAEDGHHLDELTLLEKRLEPLLADGSNQQAPEHDRHCILALSLSNLPRLRAQLNTSHFNSILNIIDQRLEQAKNLFRGVRLSAQSNAIFVQFSTLANEEEHLLHAVSCGAALMTLCRELEQDEGLPLELRLAIAPFSPPEDSRWGTDLCLEDTIEHLVELLQVANPWEMLIDRALITQDELSFCDTDPLSSCPAELFRGFTPQQQLTHERQVDFLRGRKLPNPL